MREYIEDDDGVEHKVPTRWAICGRCSGNGTLALHGIAITSDEWAHDWSPEEQEGYMRGAYDTACETCGGDGKVREPDWDRMDAALRKLVEDDAREEEQYQAMCAAERRMGA